MAERLSISMIKDEVKMFDEYIDIPFTAQGKEVNVRLYPFFSPTAIRDMVNDLAEFFRNAKKEKVKYKDEEFDDIVGYFILRHFTDIKFTKSKKAKTLYDEFKIIVNSQVFKVLLETIPKESIKAVYDRIFEIIELSAEFENRIKEIQKQIQELPLENRDILFGKENNANKESVE